MRCAKCNHEHSYSTCPYCKREEARSKYSDKYLYDNIIRIEYMDWDSEADCYGRQLVPQRYVQIRDNDEGCGIDIAGYVERKNEDFDNEAYQKMSGFEQFLYGFKRYRLEYVEESAGLSVMREIIPDYLKRFIAHYFFGGLNYNCDIGEFEHTFLENWPTFQFDTDYLREYEHWDDSEADETCISYFELVFELRNGEKILIDGVQNDYSEALFKQLMSDAFVYFRFKDTIRLYDWNHMFKTSLDRNDFAKCVDVIDKCHSGEMAQIRLLDSYFDNQNTDEDYVDIVFEITNKTNKPINIHAFCKTITTAINTKEEIEEENSIICELQPEETKEAHIWIDDNELKHSYITPNYLLDRYGEPFENSELCFSNITFQMYVEQGNDIDIEYSNWQLKATEFFDLSDEDEIDLITIYCRDYAFRLGEGEYHRYSGFDDQDASEYLCVGQYKGNYILFHYIDQTGEVVDYIKETINNVPQFAFDYLMNILNENNDIAVRMIYFPGVPTSFEIYYHYNQNGYDIPSLIKWMGSNNDFSAKDYRYTEVVNGHQRCIGSDKEDDKIKYTPSDVLYIYKGNIRCHRFEHNIIQATAVLHNQTDNEIELNVEYCTECKKFILEYIVFEQYRNRYGVLVGNFRMVVNGEFDGEYDLAEESPLMLSGYNVSQRDGYTSQERHYILARIIHDEIMDKGDVIRYLSYFIRKNGAKRGNELALSKWEEDLAFVQEYDISTQPRAIISDIKRY